jgi:GH3 auxin-responsive promoter
VSGGRVAGPLVRGLARARVAQWDRRARDPRPAQLATLLAHCRSAAVTEFGRAHGLGRVRSYGDFQTGVPARAYADFEPWLERMRQGERDVLWPGLIPFYGQSSGSSNTAAQHKFLPISHEQIRWQQKAAFDLVARYLVLSGDRDLTGGYALGLFPPSILRPESPGVEVGSNPGIMLRHVPRPVRWVTLPRPAVRDIVDYDAKLTAIAEHYLDHDVRSVAGTTCWFPVFFDRLLRTAWALGRPVASVAEIWPRLRVLFGGGVYAEPYRRIIEERMGGPIVIMDNYNATEGGIFAVTDRLDDSGMLVLPDRGVFFEFVPRSQHGRPDAPRLPLWEVERDVDYSVILTTAAGLFAYYVGDFVRFTSTFPHRLQFVGRPSGVLSLTQELTSFIEIERAVAAGCAAAPCILVDYAAASEVGVDGTGKGRYVLFVEFEREPDDLARFTAAIDGELMRLNRVYGEHRTGDVAILAPRLVPLAAGATRSFMEQIGYHSVQNKFPRILDAERRDLLAALSRAPSQRGSMREPEPGVSRFIHPRKSHER